MQVTAHTSVGAGDWCCCRQLEAVGGGPWGNIGVAVGEGVAESVASER